MGRRGCASAMGMIKFPSSCSSPKALCNQFIDYYICSRGVFCINHIKLRNFVVITIECSIATVDRGSIMTRIYRWSMMVYSSLQAEFMVTNVIAKFRMGQCVNVGITRVSSTLKTICINKLESCTATNMDSNMHVCIFIFNLHRWLWNIIHPTLVFYIWLGIVFVHDHYILHINDSVNS